MLGFIKKVSFTGLTILWSINLLNAIPLCATPLKCVSMTNQACKVRSQIVNVNSHVFYTVSIKTSKYSGTCNNINDPYAKVCVPDVKKLNIKVFNITSRTNETRHIEWHGRCKSKCRLARTCNNRKNWNGDKCRRECKELIYKGLCDKGFIWNPCNCECEYNKSCDIGEYLYYKNCKFREKNWPINWLKNVL